MGIGMRFCKTESEIPKAICEIADEVAKNFPFTTTPKDIILQQFFDFKVKGDEPIKGLSEFKGQPFELRLMIVGQKLARAWCHIGAGDTSHDKRQVLYISRKSDFFKALSELVYAPLHKAEQKFIDRGDDCFDLLAIDVGLTKIKDKWIVVYLETNNHPNLKRLTGIKKGLLEKYAKAIADSFVERLK